MILNLLFYIFTLLINIGIINNIELDTQTGNELTLESPLQYPISKDSAFSIAHKYVKIQEPVNRVEFDISHDRIEKMNHEMCWFFLIRKYLRTNNEGYFVMKHYQIWVSVNSGKVIKLKKNIAIDPNYF